MSRRDRVRERTAELLLEGTHEHGNYFEGLCRSSCGYRSKKRCEYFARCGYRVFIDQILSLSDEQGQMIAVLDEDQTLPENPYYEEHSPWQRTSAWHETELTGIAYARSQRDMAKWRKVVKE